MQLNSLFVANILLLFVNLITVVGNIFIPRLLDKPDLQVVSIDALVDENEIRLPNSNSSVLAAVIANRKDGDSFYSSKRCFSALNDQGLVPTTCQASLLETLRDIKGNSENQRIAKIKALRDIENFDEGKLIEALTISAPLGYISTFYNDVFFNLLAAENIAKDEIAAPMRAALVSAAISLVEREFAYIDTVDAAISTLERGSIDNAVEADIVLRVVFLNSGFVTGLISPNAQLILGERDINLRLIDSDSLGYENLTLSEHRAVREGSSETLFFYIDPRQNTVESNRFVQGLFKSAAAIDYRIALETSTEELIKNGTMETRRLSFEIDS